MIADKNIGISGLVLSITGLSYLFYHLLLKPVLPLPHEHLLKMDIPVAILVTCALSGLIFIGTLSIFTVYVMHVKEKCDPLEIKNK